MTTTDALDPAVLRIGTTADAVDHLIGTFGEVATEHLVNLLSAKELKPSPFEAAVRVMAKRNIRGADYAHLVNFTQHFADPIR